VQTSVSFSLAEPDWLRGDADVSAAATARLRLKLDDVMLPVNRLHISVTP
jgi:hypothetical protein